MPAPILLLRSGYMLGLDPRRSCRLRTSRQRTLPIRGDGKELPCSPPELFGHAACSACRPARPVTGQLELQTELSSARTGARPAAGRRCERSRPTAFSNVRQAVLVLCSEPNRPNRLPPRPPIGRPASRLLPPADFLFYTAILHRIHPSRVPGRQRCR